MPCDCIDIPKLKENAKKSYEIGEYANARINAEKIITYDTDDYESYWIIVKCRMNDKEKLDVLIPDKYDDDSNNPELCMPEYRKAVAYAIAHGSPKKADEYKRAVKRFNYSIKAKEIIKEIAKYLLFAISIFLLVIGIRKCAGGNKVVASADTNGTINITINGKPVEFEAPPCKKGGRIMVQIRAIVLRLGYEIYWDDETQTSYIHAKNVEVQKIASKGTYINVYVDNKPVEFLDQKPLVIGGYLFTPCREVVEALGCGYEQDETNQTAEN